MNEIIINRKPSAAKIFAGWVLIFLIPVLMFNLSINYLFDITRESNQLLYKETLINELLQFEKDIEPGNFLDAQFKNFKSQTQDFVKVNSAEKLSNLFFRQTGIPLSGLILHGPGTRDLNGIFFKKSIQEGFKNLSRTLTLKFFQFLNSCSANFNSNEKLKNDKLKNISENFFQKQFGLISMIPIEPEKISPGFSIKFKGFCYFYYQPLPGQSLEKGISPAGFLAMVSGEDLDIRKIFQGSTGTMASGVERSIIFRPWPIETGKYLDLSKKTTFNLDSEGLSLIAPAPQGLIAHFVSGGRIYPRNLAVLEKSFPFLKLTVPLAKIEHPLFYFWPGFQFFSVLFTLTGGILALRLFLFGLDLRLKLTGKAVLALIVLAILPAGLLLISFLTYRDVCQKLDLVDANNFLKQRIESVSRDFSGFINDYHQQAYLLSRDLASKIGFSEKEVKAYMLNRLEKMEGHEAFLDFFGKPAIHAINTRIKKSLLSKPENSIRYLMIQANLRALDGISSYNDEKAFDGGVDLFKDAFFVDPNFINQTLVTMGRMMEMDQIKALNSFSLNPIYATEAYQPTAYLTVKFSQLHLIDIYLKKSSWAYHKIGTDFRFFVYTDVERRKNIEGRVGRLTSQIRHKIDRARELGTHFFWWQEEPHRYAKCLYVLPRFPLVIMAEKALPESGDIPLVLLATLIYIIMLLYFSYSIFARQLLNPIEFLSASAKLAGQGDFKTRLNYESEGEFLQLKSAFDKMVDGIAQKEKLSEFVSAEILETVVQEGIGLPQKLDSTIVFAEIPSLDHLFKSGDSEKGIKILDLCISEADNLAKKFSGTLEKIAGNTLMLVFREKEDGSHALNGCNVTIELRNRLGLHNISLNFGIASGVVISGAVGDQYGRVDFTVIGDAVNLAARLKGIASSLGSETKIIVAPSTIRKLKGKCRLKFVKKMPIKGKSREFPIYQLLEVRN
jgi:class 3 adenylate cyclase